MSVLHNVIQQVIRPVIGTVIDDGAGAANAAFYAPLSSSLTLTKGTGPYSFTGASVAPAATVTDFEGIIHNCKANEARLSDVRRVENLATASEDATDAGYSTAATTVTLTALTYNGMQVSQIGFDADVNARIIIIDPVDIADHVYNISYWIRAVSGTVTGLNQKITNGAVNTSKLPDLTEEWIRYSHYGTATSGEFTLVQNNDAGDAGDVYITGIQIENVTGQTLGEQGIPGDYVSVGVGTGDEFLTGDSATFDSGLGDWINGDPVRGSVIASAGQMVITSDGVGGYARAAIAYPFKAGKKYAMYGDITTSAGSTGVAMSLSPASGAIQATSLGVGRIHTIFTPIVDSNYLIIFPNSGTVGRVSTADNLSIKEIDHGSNVDGVKYFPYHNTLEVVDNVVIGTGGRGAELVGDTNFDDTGWWDVSAGAGVIEDNKYKTTTVSDTCKTTGLDFSSIPGYVEMTFSWIKGSQFDLFEVKNGPNVVFSSGTTPNQGIVHNERIVFYATGNNVVRFATAAMFDYIHITNPSLKRIDVSNSYVDGGTFGRRVENLFSDSENLEGNWVAVAVTIDDADTVTFTAQNGRFYQLLSTSEGLTYTYQIKCKNIDGNTGLRFYHGDSASGNFGATVTLTSEYQIFTVSFLGKTGGGNILIGMQDANVSGHGTIDVEWQQVEVSVDTPGEYASTDVGVFPFSGTGLDGVAEFATTNPNQVVSNVVTADLTTYPVTAGDKVLIEEERTNYADTDDPNTQVTATLTSGTSYTISVSGDASITTSNGTGTFTGHGTATLGTDVTVACTGNGTLTLTLDSGTLDVTPAGDNVIQCEAGTFSTSFIPSPGATAVTRTADLLEYPAANYSDEMTIVGEFTLDRDSEDAGIIQVIFSFHDSVGTHLISAYLDASGRFISRRIGSANYTESSGVSYLNAGKHKVAAGFSLTGVDCYCYVDGVRIDATPALTLDSTALTIDEFFIGRHENDDQFINGNVGDIKIYNKLLDAADAQDLSRVEST